MIFLAHMITTCQAYGFVEVVEATLASAHEVGSFVIDGATHIALTSPTGSNGKIFRWSGTSSSFEEVQSLVNDGGGGLELFDMNGTQMLVTATPYDGTSYNVHSTFYQWESASGSFVEFQRIPTWGGWSWCAFTLDGVQHLAVANSHEDSKIYRWDGANGTFVEFQSLTTSCARSIEAFNMDGIQHLVVANVQITGGHSCNTDSKIYKWEAGAGVGGSFVEFQHLAASGANSWSAFTIDGVQYLAMASSSQVSKIYQGNSTVSFLELQSIPTSRANALVCFRQRWRAIFGSCQFQCQFRSLHVGWREWILQGIPESPNQFCNRFVSFFYRRAVSHGGC